MALYLVQHGKNLPKDQDPEKGLSPEGSQEVQKIAEVARNYGIKVAAIEHSGKKRARQTAEIFAQALAPSGGLSERSDIGPLDDVAAVAGSLSPRADGMLVGHLPFMERLTAYLLTGNSEPAVFKFQNGGIVCLDQNPEGDNWMIFWTLMPHIR